jgi:cytoskeletal protein CcmA (bactofilin family)
MNTILRNNASLYAKSIFVGGMEITGDLLVDGDVEVSGSLSAGLIQQYSTFSLGEIPTFYGSLEILGSLIVSGTLKASGAVVVED